MFIVTIAQRQLFTGCTPEIHKYQRFRTKHLIEMHYNCLKIRHYMYIKQHSHIHLSLDCGEETNPKPIS